MHEDECSCRKVQYATSDENTYKKPCGFGKYPTQVSIKQENLYKKQSTFIDLPVSSWNR